MTNELAGELGSRNDPAVPLLGLSALLVSPITWFMLKYEPPCGTIVGVVKSAIPAPPPIPSSISTPAIAGCLPQSSQKDRAPRNLMKLFISRHTHLAL